MTHTTHHKRLVAAALVLAGVTAACGGGTTSDSPTDRRFEAFDVCTQFVEDRLKAPATAKFRNPYQDDGEVSFIAVPAGGWTVRSTVDAQNGFGALVRNDFICTVRPEGERWSLVTIKVD